MRERWRPCGRCHEVSEHGRVRNRATGKVLKQQRHDGYMQVSVTRRHRYDYVHRLVLIAFAGPPPPGHECHHKNGVRVDNALQNLEWVTRSQNQIHCVRLGRRIAQGSHHPKAKLSEFDVMSIRHLSAHGRRNCDLAEDFNISRPVISLIINRKIWRHI